MKLLKEIVYKSNIINIKGDTNIVIENIGFDSNIVSNNTLFIAIKGIISDGHNYIDDAIKNGAIAVVCEKYPSVELSGVTYVQVKNSAKALGVIASNYFDNPSEKIKLIGITGTNGKTTCATLLYQLFLGLGQKSGLISTVEIKIASKQINTTHTTPDSITINKVLAQMVEENCKYCFMEVSSHSLVQERVAGLDFNIAAFTNLSHDHLDYHKKFDDYILAKKILFDNLSKKAIGLVNKDDKHGATMLYHTKATKQSFALKSPANYKCKILNNSFKGLHLNIAGHDFYSKLIGTFNAYNILLVYTVATLLYKDKMQVLTILSALESVAGRYQYLNSSNGIIAIVDYAHTPDALKNVLKNTNEIHEGKGKIITVFGCGGDRDKDKRPLMAAEAVKNSNKVILTSDNPRSEDPNQIISDMIAGIDPSQKNKVLSIVDRKEAIKTAINIANKNDVILVAGKGHEKYQEIEGKKNPFDDVKVIRETFKTIV